MAQALKVKKGDLVQVLSGKDRGKRGRILEARPREGRVIVENLNMIKRHSRPKPISNPSRMGGAQFTPGGVIEKAAPIPISNVMLVCPTCNRPTRVGYVIRERQGEDPIKIRVCRRDDCRQEIDK